MLRRIIGGILRGTNRHTKIGSVVMDVTKSNFDASLLNEIEEKISGCSFMSLDLEFSGLQAESGLSPLDTLSERYASSIRPSVTSFMAFQFGLSLFTPDARKEQSGAYRNQTYNFYVWQGSSIPSVDNRFLSQSSSIDFLAYHGFDFNKLFREGISYIRLSDAKTLRQNLIERQEQQSSARDYASIPIPEQQKDFLKDIHQRIDLFIKDQDKDEPIELPNCNAFQRRIIYQTVQESFGDEVYIQTNKKRILCVHKQKNRTKAQQLELEEFEKSMGFSKIIRMMSESKKPIVGHNMMLDLCFTLNQFVAPLPETYSEFKALVQETFGEIYDTKVMASIPPIKDHVPNSALEDLRARLKESPFKCVSVVESLKVEEGDATDTYHEAGFDAYVTGLCFIGMQDYLESKCSLKDQSLIMRPYANKLAVMRIVDVPYSNLAGEELVPERAHVFYVTFPSIWKTSDLNSLFSAFGNIHIHWLNDNSAYVSLYQKELAGTVMDSLNCSSVYTITPYAKYKSRGLPTSITPLFEKSEIFSNNVSSSSPSVIVSKKRAVSPNGGVPESTLKRSKSKPEAPKEDLFPESSNWN